MCLGGQCVLLVMSLLGLMPHPVQGENKEEAALDALLDPERNTMLQVAAADAASSSTTRTAAEHQVWFVCSRLQCSS